MSKAELLDDINWDKHDISQEEMKEMIENTSYDDSVSSPSDDASEAFEDVTDEIEEISGVSRTWRDRAMGRKISLQDHVEREINELSMEICYLLNEQSEGWMEGREGTYEDQFVESEAQYENHLELMQYLVDVYPGQYQPRKSLEPDSFVWEMIECESYDLPFGVKYWLQNAEDINDGRKRICKWQIIPGCKTWGLSYEETQEVVNEFCDRSGRTRYDAARRYREESGHGVKRIENWDIGPDLIDRFDLPDPDSWTPD